MTFEEYIVLANKRVISKRGQERAGQAMFNALNSVRPEIADDAVGTYIDPFYNDLAIGDFLTFVMAKW